MANRCTRKIFNSGSALLDYLSLPCTSIRRVVIRGIPASLADMGMASTASDVGIILGAAPLFPQYQAPFQPNTTVVEYSLHLDPHDYLTYDNRAGLESALAAYVGQVGPGNFPWTIWEEV